MRRAAFIVSPGLWETGFGPDHPLKPERLKRTFELLQSYNAFRAPNVSLIEPRPATRAELEFFHSPDYIDVVQALSDGDLAVQGRPYGLGYGDNPVFPRMFEMQSLKVGSTLTGAALLLEGNCDVAFSFAGGMHHAAANRASGFCIFNDAAVAIHWLIARGRRVAYVDIDVHHGDGVQNAFYDTERVLTISLHQDGRTLFPGTGFVDEIGTGAGVGYAVNVPLPLYTTDDEYVWAFKELVPPLLARFDPDIVVTQLGVDTHYKDPLASLMLTTAGYVQLVEAIAEIAPRWLALGGGGYELSVVPRAWTLAFGLMSGQTFADQIPESYCERYGGQFLRDQAAAPVREAERRWVRHVVEATVGQVKKRQGLA